MGAISIGTHRSCTLRPDKGLRPQAMTTKDAFDLWWEWAEKPLDCPLTIDGDIHYPVMELSPEDRRDCNKVNEAVRRY